MPSNTRNRFNVCDIPPEELKDRLIWFASQVKTKEQFECAALLVTTTELRANEVLAMCWNDFDEQSGIVDVKLANTQGRGICPCKIPREVQLADYPAQVLRRLRIAQGERLGTYWKHLAVKEDGLALAAPTVPVVCTLKGEHVDPRKFSFWWRDHAVDFGLAGWTLSDLRKAGRILEASDAKVAW